MSTVQLSCRYKWTKWQEKWSANYYTKYIIQSEGKFNEDCNLFTYLTLNLWCELDLNDWIVLIISFTNGSGFFELILCNLGVLQDSVADS